MEAENRVRAAAGAAALPLDETLSSAREVSASDVVQQTHWPNIDLIGAQLNLYWSEFQIPVWRMGGRAWPLWDALSNFLEDEGGLYLFSDSSLRMFWHLGGVWRLMAQAGALVPRFIRNPVYRLIAANRYRIAGRVERCEVPSDADRTRMLP